MKRDCHDAVELLARRLRTSLTDADERRLAAHLAACEGCRAIASDQDFVEALMAEWPDLPADNTAAAVAAVRARIASVRAAHGISAARVAALTAAAAILVAATFALARSVSRSPELGSAGVASHVPWETVHATATATSSAAMQDGEERPSPPKAERAVVQVRKQRPRRHHLASAPPKPTVAAAESDHAGEPPASPDLSEFFALGPPPEEPTEPEYEIQRETSTAPDGSSMTVTVFTDPQTGERVAHVVEVVVPATDVAPGEPPDAPPTGPLDGPPLSGELPRGGRIG